MPKPYTSPILYDSLKTVTISFLKTRNYLEPGGFKGGNIIWTRNGEPAGEISIKVNTVEESPYLELDYRVNGTPINYRVQLVSIPSNLGKGVIWFFICPRTGKRCRKLHCADTYFYHRSAFRGCYYEKQVQSHKYRNLGKQFGLFFGIDKVYEEIHSKHFKKRYNGKLTKRYLKLLKQIEADKDNSDNYLQLYRALKV